MTRASIILIIVSINIGFVACSTRPRINKSLILSELNNPHEIISDDKHLVISDGKEGTTLYVYDINDYSLYSEFGGNGETPDKFIVSEGHEVDVDIRKDTLLVTSHWKTTFFTKKGKLIGLKKIEEGTSNYKYLGKNFIGQSSVNDNGQAYNTFNLYDENFEFKREVTRILGSNQKDKGLEVLVRKYQGITSNNNFIFKGRSEELKIEKYNSQGIMESVYTYPYKPIKIDSNHKEDILNTYKEHPLFGQFFEDIKKIIVFPEYLPAIYNINISNSSIYVLTYEVDGENSIIYKFNISGNFLKKVSVPLIWKNSTEVYPFTISNDMVYQVVKKLDEQVELKIIEL